MRLNHLKKLNMKRQKLKINKFNRIARCKGQAMAEYVVILVALSAALMTAGNGMIGFSKDDEDSLVQALHNRYTTQAYALSISEIPEGAGDLGELANYYLALDKYPALRPKLQTADAALTKVTTGLAKLNLGLDGLKEYTDPKKALDLIDTDTIKDQIKDELKNALNPF
jgi:Flp pilus assembly pilin Flp